MEPAKVRMAVHHPYHALRPLTREIRLDHHVGIRKGRFLLLNVAGKTAPERKGSEKGGGRTQPIEKFGPGLTGSQDVCPRGSCHPSGRQYCGIIEAVYFTREE
jgi:hypothetical protein